MVGKAAAGTPNVILGLVLFGAHLLQASRLVLTLQYHKYNIVYEPMNSQKLRIDYCPPR